MSNLGVYLEVRSIRSPTYFHASRFYLGHVQLDGQSPLLPNQASRSETHMTTLATVNFTSQPPTLSNTFFTTSPSQAGPLSFATWVVVSAN